jgi:phosphatidylinositol glycan class B
MSSSNDVVDTPISGRPTLARKETARDRLTSAISKAGLPQFLLLAVLLRVAVMPIAIPVHPDEVFQYLETAHRLLFGQGVITWEWRQGVRGWLLPLLTSVPMKLGAWLDPNGALYLILPNLMMVAVSLVTVVAAWRLGERLSRLHAQVAAFVAAIWYESIYFAPHVMSETASSALILAAALVLTDRARWTGIRLAFAAALLANAAAIRFQLLPAIATLVVACCVFDVRRCWRPLLLGGLVGLAPSALCDLAMGGVPFAWIIENFRINIGENRAAFFSSSGPLGYFGEAWPHLTLWSVPLLALAGVGARRYPALAWVAAANLIFHSAIAHKEYRFILLSVLLVVLLAAIGTVDWVRSIERRRGVEAGRSKLRFLCLVWIIASVSCAVSAFRTQWIELRPEMNLYARLHSDPALCGLAVYRRHFTATGGYAYLHRSAAMLYFTTQESAQPWTDLARNADAFNTVMTPAAYASEMPRTFAQLACEGSGESRICLYRRPGACADTGQGFRINAVLKRLGE